jgi:hypothetical protein
MILSIDPGNIESAYVVLDDNLKPLEFGKIKNEDLLYDLNLFNARHENGIEHFAIEMIASYGMGVGKEVFDTCVWIGRFIQKANYHTVKQVYRGEVKMNMCHIMKANDSNVILALTDRFAYGIGNHGKGTKKDKGWFYGFSKDVWQAYAVGVTYHDLYIK